MHGGLIFFLRLGEAGGGWVGVWPWVCRPSAWDTKPEELEAVLRCGLDSAIEHTSTEWRRGSSNQE